MNANKSEADLLSRNELKTFRERSAKQFRIEYVLSHPSKEWEGRKRHVDAELIKEVGFKPGEGSVALRCGSPEMIKKATLQALREGEYAVEENCFGFLRCLVYVERDTMHCLVLELIPGGTNQY